MDGECRRKKLIEMLAKSPQPLSGSELAKRFSVSRQVIVQDIALVRAGNKNILSTNKGYLLYDPAENDKKAKRTIFVQHTNEQIREELLTIIDTGGKVLDVVVAHEIYGQITVDLLLKTRQDVEEFVRKLSSSSAMPLKVLTNGRHYHTIEAENSEILDRIEQALAKKGILC